MNAKDVNMSGMHAADASRFAIRAASASDLPAINAIYNHYVPRSTCTYQTEPESAEGRRAWFEAHGGPHPVIVAEDAGEVVGWASLSPFRARAAYRFTVEDSVYVRHDCQRRGIGSRLIGELIGLGGRLGLHAIIAGIDSEQAPSIELHRRLGFTEVGHFRQVGYKFDRWLDVIFMECLLQNRAADETEPRFDP